MNTNLQTLPPLNPLTLSPTKDIHGSPSKRSYENKDPKSVKSTDSKENSSSSSRILFPSSSPASLSELNLNTGKRKIQNWKLSQSTNSKQRKVHQSSSNLAGSLDCKTADKFNPNTLIDHGFIRVQTFALQALGYYKSAVQSDGTIAPINIWVAGARVQVGQAHIPNFHAAHPCASSGVCDNRLELMPKEIAEKGISPNKKKTLEAKSFPDEGFNELKQCGKNEALIRRVITKYIGNPASIIEDEDAINLTHSVPGGEVNLTVDKSFEKEYRPKIAELLTKCARGELSVEQATEQYVKIICKFFHECLLELEAKKEKNPGHKDAEKWGRLMVYYQKELQGTEMPPFEHLFGVYDPISKTSRKMNESELMDLHYQLLRKPLKA